MKNFTTLTDYALKSSFELTHFLKLIIGIPILLLITIITIIMIIIIIKIKNLHKKKQDNEIEYKLETTNKTVEMDKSNKDKPNASSVSNKNPDLYQKSELPAKFNNCILQTTSSVVIGYNAVINIDGSDTFHFKNNLISLKFFP